MKLRRTATAILTVFITILLVFTLFGEDMHRLTIPKVAVVEAKRKSFPVEMEYEGQILLTTRMSVAIPKTAVRGTSVFILTEDDDQTVLSERIVETGEELLDFIEIRKGVPPKAKVVIGSDRDIAPGDRVIETEYDEQIRVHEDRKKGDVSSEYLQKCWKKNVLCCIIVILVTIVLLVLFRLVFHRKEKALWKLRFLRYPLALIYVLLVCWFLRESVVLPGEWIPVRLIDIEGWRTNIANFPIR